VSRKAIIATVVIALVGIGAAAAWHFTGKDGATPALAAEVKGKNFVVTPDDMTMGNPKAKVVLIEYAAPRCPHCAHFAEETFPPLKKNYIDTGKVLYVFRVLPLAAADGVAEKLARCQPRDKYFPFMDNLFRTQKEWDDMYGVTDVRGGLLKQSKAFGMTEAQFEACIADTKRDAVINQVAEEGVKRYNLSSTPSIVINGVLTPDVAEYAPLAKALDAALAGK
jgi:protein-disulfide isomerase